MHPLPQSSSTLGALLGFMYPVLLCPEAQQHSILCGQLSAECHSPVGQCGAWPAVGWQTGAAKTPISPAAPHIKGSWAHFIPVPPMWCSPSLTLLPCWDGIEQPLIPFWYLPQQLHRGYATAFCCSSGLVAQTQHIFKSLWSTECCYSFLFHNSHSHVKDFALSAFFFSSRLTKSVGLLSLMWVGNLRALVLPLLLATSPSLQTHGPCVSFLYLPKRLGSPHPSHFWNATKDLWRCQWKCFTVWKNRE